MNVSPTGSDFFVGDDPAFVPEELPFLVLEVLSSEINQCIIVCQHDWMQSQRLCVVRPFCHNLHIVLSGSMRTSHAGPDER